MKALVIALSFVFLAFGGFAQQRNQLKGPAAKNFKAWQHDVKPTAVVTTDATARLQGPAAKNQRPFQSEAPEVLTFANTSSNGDRLMGPAAKNHKPWRQSNAQFQNIADSDMENPVIEGEAKR